MLYHIACRFANTIRENTNRFDEYELEKIRFGIEALLSESIKFTLLLVFFILTKKVQWFLSTTITLFIYRPFIGGIHFNNHFHCFLATCVFYLLARINFEWINHLSLSLSIYYASVLFLTLILCKKAYKPTALLAFNLIVLILCSSINTATLMSHLATLPILTIQNYLGGLKHV